MAEKAKSKKKSKPSPFAMSPRTLALGVVFLGLIAFVGYQYLRTSQEELPPEPEQVLDEQGKPVPPPQPLVEPEPGTMPPGNREEVRPS